MTQHTTLSAMAAIKQIYKAAFPVAQLPALKRHLNALDTAEQRIQAGLYCRSIENAPSGFIECRIAIVSNFSYQPIADSLRCRLLGNAVRPEFYLADYNQYYYELLDNQSQLYQFNPAISLCLLDCHAILDELNEQWRIDDIEAALRHKLQQLTQLAENYAENNKGLLIFNTLPLSSSLLKQCLEYRGRARLSRWWSQFNGDLCALAEQYTHVQIIDTQTLLNGNFALHDPRLSFYTGMMMSEELLDAIAGELCALTLAHRGLTKKCLVLDLDNTLWGGILGDDGVDGIQLSNSSTGEAFISFQSVIQRLARQGVLLAISSKNDHDTVIQLFKQRQDMVLQQDDFSVIQANWQPKSQAMARISEQLNIGCDSLVFIDDSAFEREEVARVYPQMTIINPGEDPAEYIERLLKNNDFCQLQLNATDYQRNTLYKTELQRQSLQQTCHSLEEFWADLQPTLQLLVPSQTELPRISQLSLRTNQFNMTALRMSESEVNHFLAQPRHGIIGLQSSDRFGHYGLIGAIFIHVENAFLWIDNFLLSCRVFSRQLEMAALRHLLHWAKNQGYAGVKARYYPTNKNQKIADFYLHEGFVTEENHSNYQQFNHPLQQLVPLPEHIQLTPDYLEDLW